jgi:hypothetical protein
MKEPDRVARVQREDERTCCRSSGACGETKLRNNLRPDLPSRRRLFPQSPVILRKRSVFSHRVRRPSEMTEPEINTSLLLVVDALLQLAWPITERRAP